MSEHEETMILRKASVAVASDSNAPTTLDIEKRSVGIVISTENPITEWDYRNNKYLPTVIRASGVKHPMQVPLLDTHSRGGVQDVIGSVRNIRVEGDQLVGDAFYASTPAGDAAFTLVREGHLTDYSIGCLPDQISYEGKDAELRKVISSSMLMEVSNCPVGADASAKMRAAVVENQQPPAQPQPTENPSERSMTEEEMKAKEATIRSAAIAEQKEVVALCRTYGLEAQEMIGRSVVEVKEEALKRFAAKNAPATETTAAPSPIVRGNEAADHLVRAAESALALRQGLVVEGDELKRASEMRVVGMSPSELSREILRAKGQNHYGHRDEVIQRAISTSDFGTILGNIANKFLKQGWGKANVTWSRWCEVGSVNDFKTITMTRALATTKGFRQVAEGGEYKMDSRADEKETFAISKYGDRIAYTYEAMKNDDLNQLTDSAQMFGEMAAQLIEELAFGVLTANAAMGDSVALFHATHSNLGSGAITEGNFNTARIAMRKQVEGLRYLNIEPKFLFAPVELQITADKLLGAAYDPTATNSITPNTVSNMIDRDNRIYSPLLTGNPWFLGAGRNTVKMFFMDGKQTPTLEQKTGYEVDGIDFKARLEVGAKAMDWRGLYKSTGV